MVPLDLCFSIGQDPSSDQLHILNHPVVFFHVILRSAVWALSLAHRIKAAATTAAIYRCDGESGHFPMGRISAKGYIYEISSLDDSVPFFLIRRKTVIDPPGPEGQMQKASSPS